MAAHKIRQMWQQYKYRFVPWIAINLKNRSVRSVKEKSEDKIIADSEVISCMQTLFTKFQQFHQKSELAVTLSKVSIANSTSQHEELVPTFPVDKEHAVRVSTNNMRILFKNQGFEIKRCKSILKHGGTGVIVSKGTVPKHSLVAIYPGTLYFPSEPILFQSMMNPFIFRCIDGLLIDGNDKAVSRFLYRSCAQRDRMGPYLTSDLSWLTSYPINPLAVGQYVNNKSKDCPANVAYQEVDLPTHFPFPLLQYIPHVHYTAISQAGGNARSIRMVALISLRDITVGEELFSSYFTVIH